MATHSSTLAWKIPRTEEPGRLKSMELQRVGQLSDFTFFLSFMRLGEKSNLQRSWCDIYEINSNDCK